VTFKKNSHCSYCGQSFREEQPWPRTCAHCSHTSFLNPIPVAVVLIPVDDGLLFVRRGIEPRKGKLTLPGGFINLGETWQQAGAREVWEETGLAIAPEEIRELCVRSAPDGTLLIFGVAQARTLDSLPPFAPSDEVTEQVVLSPRQFAELPRDELAFPLHADVVEAFFLR
jgi:ADP-ribose pyrophosphatase YjhB (NUDIX family)